MKLSNWIIWLVMIGGIICLTNCQTDNSNSTSFPEGISPKQGLKYLAIDTCEPTLLKLSNPELDESIEYYSLSINRNDDLDTLRVIEELLSLEGDTRLLCMSIISTQPMKSSSWDGDHRVSVQVYALWLICDLINEGFHYDHELQVLMSNSPEFNSDYGETISGPLTEKAYKKYKHWFRTRKANHNDYAMSAWGCPLNDLSVFWK